VKRLGIPESSLFNWVRLSRAGKLRALERAAVPVKRSMTEIEAENSRLRRELASCASPKSNLSCMRLIFGNEAERLLVSC